MNSDRALSNSVSILVYGSDKLLLDTRTMVLENAGFRVFSATESEDAETIIETQGIALIVLCHSLSPQRCEAALRFANALQPAVKTLVLTAGAGTCPEKVPTAVLSAFDGPGELVETVQRLCAM